MALEIHAARVVDMLAIDLQVDTKREDLEFPKIRVIIRTEHDYSHHLLVRRVDCWGFHSSTN